MSPADQTPLARLLDAMRKAGLDTSVDSLRDAFWLALQTELRLDGSIEASPAPMPLAPPPVPQTQEVTGVAPTPAPLPSDQPRDTPAIAKDRPSPAPDAGVYGAGAGSDDKETWPASPLRIPAGAALAQKLPLTRSLRPLRKWYRNPRIQELDEEATVEATAEARGVLMPVLRSTRERWFELVVVADSAQSMDVWFETMVEFEQVARTAGVFRDVRHYSLVWRPDAATVPADPDDRLSGALLLNADGVAFPASGLAQTNVRRLILLATNGSSGHWNDGRMSALLAVWSKQCSVALLQMLPAHLWSQTRTGEPELLLRTFSPGAPTASLDASAFWWEEDLVEKRISGAIPVLPLDPVWLSKWARMQMGEGLPVPAVVVGVREARTPDAATRERTESDWKRAVDAFTRNCSPEARTLAIYLSRGSFTLPVARLVQAAKLGAAASQTQLAEILLSGLVQRSTPAGADVPREWVQYVFHPEAATILSRGLRESDANEIADALQKHIEHYWGKQVDFRALVYDPDGLQAIPKAAQPFALLGQALVGRPTRPKSVEERFSRFTETQSPELLVRAARFAATSGESFQLPGDSELADALVAAELVIPRGQQEWWGPTEWQFEPGVVSLFAKFAGERPLLGVKILWVDDTPGKIEVGVRTLTGRGASIQAAQSTSDAVVWLRKTRFDVVISDMKRGADDRAAFSLLSLVKELGVTAPVIIFSSGASDTARTVFGRTGAFWCTRDLEELFNLVQSAATIGSGRPVRAQVSTVLGLLEFGPRIGEFLRIWQDSPEQIADELLARETNGETAVRNHLQVIEAYAGSRGSQFTVLGANLVSDGGPVDYAKAYPGGIAGQVAKSGQAMWVPDVTRHPDYIAIEPTAASALAVPLFDEATKEVVGVIHIEMPVRDALFPDEIDWLRRFCAPLSRRIGEDRATESPAG